MVLETRLGYFSRSLAVTGEPSTCKDLEMVNLIATMGILSMPEVIMMEVEFMHLIYAS